MPPEQRRCGNELCVAPHDHGDRQCVLAPCKAWRLKGPQGWRPCWSCHTPWPPLGEHYTPTPDQPQPPPTAHTYRCSGCGATNSSMTDLTGHRHDQTDKRPVACGRFYPEEAPHA